MPPTLGGCMRVGVPVKEQSLLDGDLLWTYAHLPRSRQLALAVNTGTSREELLTALHDIACSLLVV